MSLFKIVKPALDNSSEKMIHEFLESNQKHGYPAKLYWDSTDSKKLNHSVYYADITDPNNHNFTDFLKQHNAEECEGIDCSEFDLINFNDGIAPKLQ
jgi:hypothetical protein